MDPKKLVIYTDGASRGNPGPAAIGVVIQDERGRVIETISECIGRTTNNQAEYRAVIAGLEKAASSGTTAVELRSDSELVVNQLSGKYKVKNVALKPLSQKIDELRRLFQVFEAKYIPREENRAADKLANQALDALKDAKSPAPPPNPAIVRPATRADFAGIVEVTEQTEKLHIAGVPRVFREISSAQKMQELEEVLADEKYGFLVAEAGGKIVGYIQVGVKESPNIRILEPRRYAKVSDVAVREGNRRGGVGAALMLAAEQWAKEKGLDCIELNVWEFNRGAFSFYQKMGYNTASRSMWKDL